MSEADYDQTRLKEREKALAEVQAAVGLSTEPSAPEAADSGAVSLPLSMLVSELPGVGEKTAEVLRAHGFETVVQLAAATLEQLVALPRVGHKTAEKLLAAAQVAASAQPSPPETEAETEAVPEGPS